MRFAISILVAGFLAACVPHPYGSEYSDVRPYRAKPHVELSAFSTKDMVTTAYVRHSSGGVLLALTSAPADLNIPENEVDLIIPLDSPSPIVLNSGAYENFDRSRDLFQDGRIILVSLRENGSGAVGVFVNLLSGKKYFFAPTVTSNEALAQIRTLARRSDFTVIVPEDPRAPERLPQFPESQR
jgi:hypothetical protein